MNDQTSSRDLRHEAAPPSGAVFLHGMALLKQAYAYAQDASADAWDFALEIDKLYESGLTISDLRWLVAKGYVQHGQEVSVYGDSHRSFRPGAGLVFPDAACFVLSPQGYDFANRL